MAIRKIEIPALEPDSGPELAYDTLLHDLNGLRELDAMAPIIGSFRVGIVPNGHFPLEIRQQCVEVDIPVRFPDLLKTGDVKFSSEDAVLSLLAHGKIDAARWFADNYYLPTPDWMFNLSAGTLTETSEVDQKTLTSIEYYGEMLEPEARHRLEQPR